MYTFETSGVCAKKITFEIEDNKIKEVNFEKGCPGNLQGISKLVVGMEIEEVISRLKGITCGPKNTSCPDQLAIALSQFAENK
ncbi:TIGR03905 family TSCPD domain-containing protein [Clostridium hydrogeniformans]|uniref:TIGR03905 family TSCPD domain-containing protein n=1 Tax=Clostridium hydrogeniformans TaxID=349933 RepID=UPI000483F578|nr:TIGR03905 family TSCPD domain-containing protein [Clostridium hydrogeniformans]